MSAAEQITRYVESLEDWRGKVVAHLRTLIRDASPALTEEWKWNTPMWSRGGNVVAIGAFRDHVKVNFFKGASLPDPHKLFNAGLDAKGSRAIDIREGDKVNEVALKTLVRAAAALNDARATPARPARRGRRGPRG
jgi:hypothetical protein